ncbi:MAG: hypothetical protein KAW52_02805 [candidate division Zixibacteria bacterium]|nr:hypothetical protein [candidate division Zixibacteria bacterium]
MKREKIIKQLDWVREKYGRLEEYIKIHYGKKAPFSIIGDFCLVHLDNPDEKTIKEREEEFLKDDGLHDDCPLCQLQREEGGFVVYDGCDGWCPECKQKETCEVYDPEEWREEKIEEMNSEVKGEVKKLPNSPWSRSFVDMESIDQMPLDLAIQILLFGVLGHAAELKIDLENHNDAEDVIRSFLDPLESACQNLKSFLASESASFVPEGIPVNIQVAISALSQLTSGEFGEKAKDLIAKLEKLLKLVEQIES